MRSVKRRREEPNVYVVKAVVLEGEVLNETALPVCTLDSASPAFHELIVGPVCRAHDFGVAGVGETSPDIFLRMWVVDDTLNFQYAGVGTGGEDGPIDDSSAPSLTKEIALKILWCLLTHTKTTSEFTTEPFGEFDATWLVLQETAGQRATVVHALIGVEGKMRLRFIGWEGAYTFAQARAAASLCNRLSPVISEDTPSFRKFRRNNPWVKVIAN